MNDGQALQGRLDAIVVGASAGGVEALSALLGALPANLDVAVLVVLHLPRGRRSLLPQIFGPRCAVPVIEAGDKSPVRPGTVYLAPPDYHLLVDTGPCTALTVDPPVNYSRPSIDVLFESAADLWGRRLAGVILTGGNQDGAEGLAAVRRAGGVTLVQDPADALVPAMPAAALQLGPADRVLPLAGLVHLFASLTGAPR